MKETDKPSAAAPRVEVIPLYDHRHALQRLAEEYEAKLQMAQTKSIGLQNELANANSDYKLLFSDYRALKKALRFVLKAV